ncbi:carboxymuconolactone decarboxylase family protein [Klenkia brasiliensis]|uniref:4-carboxymuconolactone decarboxylase n=1 Tax=Klenkia brasiliensis TaxID=333142 RepID=A0A1G7QMP6_9ACTN|nr:carboxymuconolactone decarboxylase family protein [Klenkia brasiliensis]SDF99772.1 4-carboxymuconolactone decarboxylase [Klenkia brasiliensis]
MTATPGADPALYESDPVFVEQFNAWVRDEVDADCAVLTPRVRQLVRLASVVGANGTPRFEVLADGALDAVLTPVELKELVYQAVPWVGYATVSDVLRATNDLLRRRGVQLPLPEQAGTPAEPPAAAATTGDTAHLDRYVTGYLHRDVLGRGGLDAADRALVTVALLVGLGAEPAQLEEQLGDAVDAGHDRAVLLGVLTALVPAVGLARVRAAVTVLDAVLPAAAP